MNTLHLSPTKISKVTLLQLLFITLLFTHGVSAESVKFVHWWDKYSPHAGSYRTTRPNSLQYLDVNQDGIDNDAVVWYPFSMKDPLNPRPQGEGEANSPKEAHRAERPSAKFYGGMVGRYTNVSHLVQYNDKNEPVPIFDHFSQSSVEDTEGSRPCTYTTTTPDTIGHAWENPANTEMAFSEITLFVVGGGGSITDEANKDENIQMNLTALYFWKKEDFINGGAKVEKITFDDTSQLVMDSGPGGTGPGVGRGTARPNIQEIRFVVQDGNQFWISQAAIIDKESYPQEATQGMQVEGNKTLFAIKLNPLNSRWAPYHPTVNEEYDQRLYKELKSMHPMENASEKELYKGKSKQLLNDINRIEFNLNDATFVEHSFEDVQAAGVYFATYQFAHWDGLVIRLDSFRVYATGKIPAGTTAAVSLQGYPTATTTTTKGGISVNCGAFEQTVRQCSCDQVALQGEIDVDKTHVGQVADMIVYAVYKDVPESKVKKFYMLDKNGNARPWDENPTSLVAFQEGVTLQSTHTLPIYTGSLEVLGFLQVFFGYRLQDGTLVISEESIDTHIKEVNLDKRNTIPYCESIKQKCSSKN